MYMPKVRYTDGRVREVKNDGYLLRNWRDVVKIVVSTNMQGDASMLVIMRGRRYISNWRCADELWRWLDRPVLRGVTLVWDGRATECGGREPLIRQERN
jgi:hypothetical protein